METIIQNDFYKITQSEVDDKMYTIFFGSYNEPIIKSIIKTKILLGATTTQKYNSISFQATKVQTFEKYQIELERETGTKKLQYNSLLKLSYHLATQLHFLITYFSKTFLGYSPKNVIVIDKNKFIYLSSEYLLNISDEQQACITFPFSQTDFFMSPELSNITELPSFVHFKVTYFSFGCLLLYGLLGEDDFIKDDDEKTSEEKVSIHMKTIWIKNTKLYWLLKRCLVKEAKNRCILFI